MDSILLILSIFSISTGLVAIILFAANILRDSRDEKVTLMDKYINSLLKVQKAASDDLRYKFRENEKPALKKKPVNVSDRTYTVAFILAVISALLVLAILYLMYFKNVETLAL
ncbi:MAG: hypothetical protein ABIH11_03825 [Candidatus Altiarchaeota archaeon]